MTRSVEEVSVRIVQDILSLVGKKEMLPGLPPHVPGAAGGASHSCAARGKYAVSASPATGTNWCRG